MWLHILNIFPGLNAEEWARVQGCSTPEVLPFSTQAYRYVKMNENKDEGAHCSKNHLSVNNTPPVQKPRGNERGRRMSQIPPRVSETKSSPAKMKRGSLPTIKFTGLFATKNSNNDSDSILKSLQLKNEAAIRKQNQKSLPYTMQTESSPKIQSKSPSHQKSRPKSAGGTPKQHRSTSTSSPAHTQRSPTSRNRTSSQSEQEPPVKTKSVSPTADELLCSSSTLDGSVAKLSLIDCQTAN